MNSPVCMGVIGAGWFASRRHLPEIKRNPDTRLAGICRRDRQALDKLQETFEADKIYTEWREMLEDSALDAVLIATPHNLHFEPAKAALEHGLHVLLEKPMTVYAEEARELEQMAMERGLKLSTALNPPFWAHTHRLRSAIRDGRIGKLEAMNIFWTGNAGYAFGQAPRPDNLPGVVPPTMYRSDPELCGGGYLIDGGSHLISEILWLSDLRAVQVSCIMDNVPSDRRAVVTLKLENDAIASVICLGDSQSGERRVRNTFAGSDGTITVEGFDFNTSVQTRSGKLESFTEKDLPPVTGPITNFTNAILEREPLHSSTAHGVHVVEIIEAAYRSATTGEIVRL